MKRFAHPWILGGLGGLLVLVSVIVLFGGAHTQTIEEASRADQPLKDRFTHNLTDTLTSQIAQSIIQKNPTGPLVSATSSRIMINSKEVVDQALAAAKRQAAAEPFEPVLSEKMLHLTTDASQAAQQRYFIDLEREVDSALSQSLIDTRNPQKSDFQKMAQDRQKLFDTLLASPVPQPLAQLHLRFLSLLGAQKNIFAALANKDQDPLRALLATKIAPQVAADAGELNRDIADYMAAHQLQ